MPDLYGSFSGRHALIVDPSVVGQSHLLVNTGVVRLAASRYEHVTVIAETNHCCFLKDYLGKKRCERISFVPWQHRSDVIKLFRSIARIQQFDQIIFTNIEYIVFAYVNIFHSGASKRPCLWIIHSHLVTAGTSGRISGVKNSIKWLFLFVLFEKVKFVVLGTRIRENFENLLIPYFKRNNIRSVMHPIGIAKLLRPAVDLVEAPSKRPYILFMSGWHGLSLKSQELISALKQVSTERRTFEFDALAVKFEPGFEEKSFAMDYTDRLCQISKADYFLHLPGDSYRLQASGAVMDMLLTGTPIIGLETDFGEEIARIIGPFGYFFKNHDDLLSFLVTGNLDPDQAREFRSNLAAGYNKIVAISELQFDAAIAS
jgi:hypothetical protein